MVRSLKYPNFKGKYGIFIMSYNLILYTVEILPTFLRSVLYVAVPKLPKIFRYHNHLHLFL